MEHLGFRLKSSKCRYLELQEYLINGVFKLDHFDNFDADVLACLILNSLMYSATVAFSDSLVDLVSIALNGFEH